MPKVTLPPNLFTVKGLGLTITYSTSSISGVPLFNYNGIFGQRSVSGNDIRRDETNIATYVTVLLNSIPDLENTFVTLVLPRINTSDETRFRSYIVYTMAKTTIGGPNLVQGQVQFYKTQRVRGKAQLVDF
jgi:hypothetical protein